MRARMIRMIWKFISFFLPYRETEDISPNIQVFYSPPPQKLLLSLIKTYQEVYRLPPWNEKWAPERVEAKIYSEIPGGILVLLLKGEDQVMGFSWGAIVTPQEILPRIVNSFPDQCKEAALGLEELLSRLPAKLLYWDEIAILPEARGLKNFRDLILPILQFAHEKKVKAILFRTIPQANIVRLTSLMGFQVIFSRWVKNREDIYLYIPNLVPILKIVQGMNIRCIIAWVRRCKIFNLRI